MFTLKTQIIELVEIFMLLQFKMYICDVYLCMKCRERWIHKSRHLVFTESPHMGGRDFPWHNRSKITVRSNRMPIWDSNPGTLTQDTGSPSRELTYCITIQTPNFLNVFNWYYLKFQCIFHDRFFFF